MHKFFGVLIAASFAFSWYALSSITPMEESSLATTEPARVQVVPKAPSPTGFPKKNLETYHQNQSNLPGPSITWELPQQPVYEAPVLDPKWEQSWSGPTTESYPSDTTMQQQESPVVSPVLVPNLGALQERITQILERDVMPFMPKRMPLFTLPGVN
jgi:hypothetical protein